MNIQIFGTKKCNDTKKAERFFKERGIKYQFIDMKEKGLSKTHISNLVKIGYFMDIEKNKKKCLWLCDNYDKFNKKQLK